MEIIMSSGIYKLVFLFVILLVVLLPIYGIYVQLIKKKNKVKEAMGSIDVQLKKRYDLIPNILTLTNLRTQASGLKSDSNTISEKMNLDNSISSKMGQLFVNVENYPQLKSDQTMVQAMQTYNEVEEHIAAARRFYNSAVNELNNAVEIFPSSIIASALGISSCPFFVANEQERTSINASDYFNK